MTIQKEKPLQIKLRDAMSKSGYSRKELVKLIEKGSSKTVKNVCPISEERFNNILNGMEPTIMELILIGQALGKDIGYFYTACRSL